MPSSLLLALTLSPPSNHTAVVLFNFRADRMVEISKAFEYADFAVFDRERVPQVGLGT